MRDAHNLSRYSNIFNKVHVDKKWFDKDEDGCIIILVVGEDPPID
jgi:hypothetical protein